MWNNNSLNLIILLKNENVLFVGFLLCSLFNSVKKNEW